MISILRSDWFLKLMAGFTVGGLYVMFQQPALALAL